jgi:inner membrane protein
MNDAFPNSLSLSLHSRSMGLKLILVCCLALLMLIPAIFVWALVGDRKQRESHVIGQIGAQVGGSQTFLGPTLAVPYTVPQSPAQPAASGMYLVFPSQASAVVKTSTSERRRSIFRVPVFQADLQLQSAFNLAGVPSAAPPNAQLDWTRAEILVGVSNPRGALSDALLTIDGKTIPLAPARIAQTLPLNGPRDSQSQLVLLGAPASIAAPNARFSVSSSLRFSGARHISLLAWGKTTHVAMQGDWPSPGFNGGFLPVTSAIAPHGFTAAWSVPFIARGVPAQGPATSMAALGATALGVSFVEVADPYQSVVRALKYIPLFLGLVFLCYFIFEVTTGKRVHPAQYILVGIAQIIFYLLLLSLAERIGFGLGFLLAGVATVTLLSANAGWIFASRAQGFRALAVFSPLYLLIYLLLRLQDNALLVGALASFAAVAAAMYLTRRIDWYSSLPPAASSSALPGAAHEQ